VKHSIHGPYLLPFDNLAALSFGETPRPFVELAVTLFVKTDVLTIVDGVAQGGKHPVLVHIETMGDECSLVDRTYLAELFQEDIPHFWPRRCGVEGG
jgi:hypothetical protein